MSYNNSNAITSKEYCTGVARLLGVTYKTVLRYLEDGFYEFSVRELWLKGTLRVPYFGTFALVHKDEQVQEQIDENGEKHVYKVPARDVPVFTPSDNFINDVNFQGVTKQYRKRAKAGKLNYYDYKRNQRIEEFGDYGSITEQRRELAKKDFQEKLAKLKQEKEKENGKN